VRLFNKKEQNKDVPYLGLRQLALDTKPEDIGITLDNNEQVYAAVVDIKLTNGIVTLVCFFDGTVSLYYQNGGGMLGMGQKYEEIKDAGMSFLFSAGQTLQFLKPAQNFNLPDNNVVNAYLLSKENIYKAEIDMSNIQSQENHIQFLNFLIQNTLNKIRGNLGV
jgi:hypothetical protein